jgi:two-component system, OmpR family, heavy metal sensor histidine kinase CusS
MRFMHRPLSLALRLTLLFGVAAAIVFPAFGWIISQSTERHFEAEDIHELELIARAVQDVLPRVRATENFTPLEQRFDDILVGHHSASLYIAAKDGQSLYASPGPDLSGLAQATDSRANGTSVHQWSDAKHTYRVLTRSPRNDMTEGAYTLVVAVPIDFHLRFLAAFRRTLWLMIASSIVVMGLMGWVAARQGHAPLHDIVARIRRISANELNTRLPPESVPYELTDLAVSFNEMLQRVDAAFHRLSNFNADIAHELRTPITNLMTQTQVALSRARTIDEYREILYSNMEEYERMAQMVGDMLFLAQADNRPQIQNIEELDLVAEVQALFDYYEGWAEERGVALALEGMTTVSGDRPMLRRALGNLLSNAIRHTPAGGTVRVKLEPSNADDTGIVVENPGPEIPPEHLPKLFDRFYRVDPSRQRGGDGAGLGLAIVKSIVTAHGGKIDVVSAEGYTRFQITLPRRPASKEWPHANSPS